MGPPPSLRKELTQCQYCWKSRGAGVTMSRCSGCRVDIYCGRECQKNAWPSHKEKCKLNQRAITGPPTQIANFKHLRDFTSKHRPTIAQAGVMALNVGINPTRALQYVLVVFLQARPQGSEPHRAETAFIAVEAEVKSLDDPWFTDKRDELKEQLRQVNEIHKTAGKDGALFVILSCIDLGLMNVAPVGFDKDAVGRQQPGWKEWMITMLNNGLVS